MTGVREREWNWANRPYLLKYHDSHKELLVRLPHLPPPKIPILTCPIQATPNFGTPAGTVRMTTYHSHLFHDNERAVIYFPLQMQDEIERMFLLMAMLHTEIHRQDVRHMWGWFQVLTGDLFFFL